MSEALFEHYLEMRRRYEKILYSFAFLVFASLALSLQFSTIHGKIYLLVFVFSILFYLIAALCAGFAIISDFKYEDKIHMRMRTEIDGKKRYDEDLLKILKKNAKYIENTNSLLPNRNHSQYFFYFC